MRSHTTPIPKCVLALPVLITEFYSEYQVDDAVKVWIVASKVTQTQMVLFSMSLPSVCVLKSVDTFFDVNPCLCFPFCSSWLSCAEPGTELLKDIEIIIA